MMFPFLPTKGTDSPHSAPIPSSWVHYPVGIQGQPQELPWSLPAHQLPTQLSCPLSGAQAALGTVGLPSKTQGLFLGLKKPPSCLCPHEAGALR